MMQNIYLNKDTEEIVVEAKEEEQLLLKTIPNVNNTSIIISKK